MNISNVCILGGTGFVGRAIADRLSPLGMRVRVVTRSEPRGMALRVLPTAEIMVADVHDPQDLAACFDNMDAVINLVGILHERGGQTFQRCHVELPRKVAEACRKAGVGHLLHMSALGAAADGPSDYQRSKAAGEAAVREAGAVLPWTIFRPSVIFGEGDRFLNLFAGMVRWFPVIPLAGARARFQPVWVEDVARAFAEALGKTPHFGQAYELCGPRAYTLEELVRHVGGMLGRNPRIVALPDGLARLQAAVFERLPGKLITRDNLRSMSVDNVCACPFPPALGFQPAALEAVTAGYLAQPASPRGRYSGYRYHAGR